MAESLLDRGTRLIVESKRLLFDLDAMTRGGEPDAIKDVEPSSRALRPPPEWRADSPSS